MLGFRPISSSPEPPPPLNEEQRNAAEAERKAKDGGK